MPISGSIKNLPLGASFPFFPTFFFSGFLSFFLLFIFHFFSFFVHFFIFWFFHVFHFLFSFFLRKSFFFSFFLYFFQIFFIRWRLCQSLTVSSVVGAPWRLWRPDDIGRDNWDWVGPPAWERACLNSPEWSGAPRLLKRSLPRWKNRCCLLCVVVVLLCVVVVCCCCVVGVVLLLLCVVVE